MSATVSLPLKDYETLISQRDDLLKRLHKLEDALKLVYGKDKDNEWRLQQANTIRERDNRFQLQEMIRRGEL